MTAYHCSLRAMHGAHPILTCDEARIFEQDYFFGDEEFEWAAMQAAGRAVAAAVRRDFEEIGTLTKDVIP